MPTVDVLDSAMSYVEAGRPGAGPALVFLHGNPTSSYLWRRVLPEIGLRARLLAPDLIGMGESGKPPLAYTFNDHARYLAGWFDALDLRDVMLAATTGAARSPSTGPAAIRSGCGGWRSWRRS